MDCSLTVKKRFQNEKDFNEFTKETKYTEIKVQEKEESLIGQGLEEAKEFNAS